MQIASYKSNVANRLHTSHHCASSSNISDEYKPFCGPKLFMELKNNFFIKYLLKKCFEKFCSFKHNLYASALGWYISKRKIMYIF